MSEWSEATRASCIRIRDGIADVLQRASVLARNKVFDAGPRSKIDICLGEAAVPASPWFELGSRLRDLFHEAFDFLENQCACGWRSLDLVSTPENFDPENFDPAWFGPADLLTETLQLIRLFKALDVQSTIAYGVVGRYARALRDAYNAAQNVQDHAQHLAAALRQAEELESRRYLPAAITIQAAFRGWRHRRHFLVPNNDVGRSILMLVFEARIQDRAPFGSALLRE
jgi:hypothetical protein